MKSWLSTTLSVLAIGFFMVNEALCFVATRTDCTWEQFTSTENLTKTAYMLPIMLLLVFVLERNKMGSKESQKRYAIDESVNYELKKNIVITETEQDARKWKESN